MSDLIDRQAAINALEDAEDAFGYLTKDWREVLEQLPPFQPDIVRCEECLYRKICSWEKQGAKFCSFAEKREVTT